MPPAPPSLDDLRRRVDALDDQLQDVLIARAEIVEAIARRKKIDAMPPLRPGREAQILRRLLARHRGAFPKPALLRLWRELLSGTTALQTELHLAVFAPENALGFWDLARDHYGSHTPMTGFRSLGEVLRALSDGRAQLGILPVPGQGDGEPWWRFLSGAPSSPRIIARLPFGARGNARSNGSDAFVIGAVEPEASGADRSVFLIETGDDLSRAWLLNALSGAGLAAAVLSDSEPEDGTAAQLVEFDGWVTPDDARLQDALTALGRKVRRAAWLGSYARPPSPAELAAPGPR